MAPNRKMDWFVCLSFVFVGFFLDCTLSLQTHRGSARTNDYTLSGQSPDARIQVNSSDGIVILHVKPPKAKATQIVPFKVSLELLTMQLCDTNDQLKIVFSNSTSIRTVTWKVNSSFPDERYQLVDDVADQFVFIPEGRWILSTAEIVATLFQDSDEDGTCPEDSVPCSCAQESSDAIPSAPGTNQSDNVFAVQRCISQSLVCNGNPNCGMLCDADETSDGCSSTSSGFTTVSVPCTPPGSSGNNGSGSGHLKLTKLILGINLILALAAKFTL